MQLMLIAARSVMGQSRRITDVRVPSADPSVAEVLRAAAHLPFVPQPDQFAGRLGDRASLR